MQEMIMAWSLRALIGGLVIAACWGGLMTSAASAQVAPPGYGEGPGATGVAPSNVSSGLPANPQAAESAPTQFVARTFPNTGGGFVSDGPDWVRIALATTCV